MKMVEMRKQDVAEDEYLSCKHRICLMKKELGDKPPGFLYVMNRKEC